MNESLLIAITILLFLLVLFMMVMTVLFGVFIYKNWLHDKVAPETGESRLESAKAEVSKSLAQKHVDPTINMTSGYCAHHAHEKATATCAICNDLLCEECTAEYESLNFCPQHFELFLKHNWSVVETVKTTPDEAHKSFFLYEFKKNSWSHEKTPTYIMTDYKIDVTTDRIESHISLYAIAEDVEQLKGKLKKGLH